MKSTANSKDGSSVMKHNEDVGGMIFKYDLPIVNAPITLRSSLIVGVEQELT